MESISRNWKGCSACQHEPLGVGQGPEGFQGTPENRMGSKNVKFPDRTLSLNERDGMITRLLSTPEKRLARRC